MHGTFYTFLAFIFLVISSLPHPASAAEKPIFNNELPATSQSMLKAYLGDAFAIENIAQTDLNNDGIEEFIIKSGDCSATEALCTHTILAKTEEKPVVLGQFEARKLEIDYDHTNGIRNLLVFQSENNDFKYTLYVWEPNQSQYILSE